MWCPAGNQKLQTGIQSLASKKKTLRDSFPIMAELLAQAALPRQYHRKRYTNVADVRRCPDLYPDAGIMGWTEDELAGSRKNGISSTS